MGTELSNSQSYLTDESHALTFPKSNSPHFVQAVLNESLPAFLHFDEGGTSLGVSVEKVTYYRYVAAANVGQDEETDILFELHMIGGDVAMFHGSKACEAYALFLTKVSS